LCASVLCAVCAAWLPSYGAVLQNKINIVGGDENQNSGAEPDTVAAVVNDPEEPPIGGADGGDETTHETVDEHELGPGEEDHAVLPANPPPAPASSPPPPPPPPPLHDSKYQYEVIPPPQILAARNVQEVDPSKTDHPKWMRDMWSEKTAAVSASVIDDDLNTKLDAGSVPPELQHVKPGVGAVQVVTHGLKTPGFNP
jgi:hypothetical protein